MRLLIFVFQPFENFQDPERDIVGWHINSIFYGKYLSLAIKFNKITPVHLEQ